MCNVGCNDDGSPDGGDEAAVRTAIAAAVMSGNDAEAARLMGLLLGSPALRLVKG